jgi:hypothetical protein
MKYILVFLAAVFGFSADSALAQNNKALFVGEVNGRTVDSFKRHEIIPYKNFRLQPISASTNRIEIRLYELDFPFRLMAYILTYDTIFNRQVLELKSYDDSSEGPEEFEVHQDGLDVIFDKIVSSGIFSITSINRGEIKKGYRPMVLRPQGLDTTGDFWVHDGATYFLEFKVDKFYDQEFFENPDVFSDFYKDNQTLRRQKEIVMALSQGGFY